MIPPEHTHDQHDCGGDVAAYALGALEPAEAEAFRRHLETCAICRDELSAFEPVVDLLPVSAPPRRAPDHLRRRVMEAIANEPHPAPRGAGSRAVQARSASGWRPRLVPAFAGALVLALAVFAIVRLTGSSSPSTRVVAAQVVGRGTAQLRLTGDRGELVVHDFALPPTGQIYEVWLLRPGGSPQPTTALFSVTTHGDGNVGVPGVLRGVAKVLVTAEPAGGTTVPTHAPVISASLT